MELSSISANELARLCVETGGEDVWQEFVHRFQRPIALAILRTARSWGQNSTALVDDLVQEVFLRLCADDCRLLRNFVPREPDSIIGYLKVLATNVTHDKLRNEKAVKRGGSFIFQDTEPAELDGLIAAPAGASAAEKSLRRYEIDRALQSFVPQLITDRDRTIFWLYFEQGFSAREIGEIASIGLTVKGVESSIHRTTQQVREAFLRHPVSFGEKGNSGASAILKEEP
jgi:RNA polymerase sigma-70 factor (ECF subfamily)